jgi:hypothetical protein
MFSRDFATAEPLESRLFLAAQPAAPVPGPPPPATQVTDHRLFYNNSVYDAGPGPFSDLSAVADDKRAVLPGGMGGFENLSSYTRGINGILVQFFSVEFRPRDLGPDDFEFRMSADGGDPASWPLAPAPTVQIIPIPGPNSLYSLTWPDGAIKNTWLRGMVKANEHTSLVAPDVFYFGNLIGEVGDGDFKTRAMPRITAGDLTTVRRALNTAADKTSVTDFNRDGRVNSLDLAAVRSNLNQHLPLLNAGPIPLATGQATELLSRDLP